MTSVSVCTCDRLFCLSLLHTIVIQGSKLSFFQGAQLRLQKLPRDGVYIETSTFLGSLQKFEGAPREFK